MTSLPITQAATDANRSSEERPITWDRPMPSISRRQFAAGISALPLIGIHAGRAEVGADANTRVAIIDTPSDTRPWLDRLKHANIRIIARYYARNCQATLPRKRIRFNGENFSCGGKTYPAMGDYEAKELLFNKFAILSAYQFNSSNPHKFLFGLNADGSVNGSRGRNTQHEDRARSEALADAEAGLAQARYVGQPRNTGIYFGLDFNLKKGGGPVQYATGGTIQTVTYDDNTPVDNVKLVAACKVYFETLKHKVGPHYHIGVYGNGHASELLLGDSLIKYSWISESRSFEDTAKFLRSKKWHLFQNQIDRIWFATGTNCSSGLDVDTNIQNPAHGDVGAWNARGLVTVELERTRAIFERHPVAKRQVTVHSRMDQNSPPIEGHCRTTAWSITTEIDRNRTVRVMSESGFWVRVDLDDDGMADGYCLKADNFVANVGEMPTW